MYIKASIEVERVNGGNPILSLDKDLWFANDVSFNPAAVFLERSMANDKIISGMLGNEALNDPRLSDGVVVIHDQTRPDKSEGFDWPRCYIGLAVFTPDFELLKRYDQPVMMPSEDKHNVDHCGVQDPRITRVNDVFYMTYCGHNYVNGFDRICWACLARSKDIVNWQKLGAMKGEVNAYNNKDHVIFPELIDGKYYMLHRPMVPGEEDEHQIELAWSSSPEGEWRNIGKVMKAYDNYPMFLKSKVGASSVPISLGNKKYLVFYHYGHLVSERILVNQTRDVYYTACAAIFDFNKFDPASPDNIVTHRLEDILVPETTWEIELYAKNSVGKVVFLTGSYEYDEHIYMIYGGADTFVIAARVKKDYLLSELAKNPC